MVLCVCRCVVQLVVKEVQQKRELELGRRRSRIDQGRCAVHQQSTVH